ncbi:dTMP kinase [Streptomyces sp. NPDC058268]|uniref:dTMP kinase n=1 Tax=Streptomyces sp. NPDC058268 TaxID=3346413 RepID=UPI0036E1F944
MHPGTQDDAVGHTLKAAVTPAASTQHPRPAVHRAPTWRLGTSRGLLVSTEGVWGAGKTTTADLVGEQLRTAGFTAAVLHYGPRPGTIGKLSQILEAQPLRARTGIGGYAHAHHATVDVLLRLCREAHQHQTFYEPALSEHDVVIIDHGVYSKLAWALTVLTETQPTVRPGQVLQRLHDVVAPWFLHPDLAVFLNTPWPLARERAIARGRGGGNPAAIERLLFLPRYEAAYRRVLDVHHQHVLPIQVGLREAPVVAAEMAAAISDRLRAPLPAPRASDFDEMSPLCPS